METEKWVVGNEYDDLALGRLVSVLDNLQYDLQDRWSGLAGSQDIHNGTAVGPKGKLMIKSETYVGLSVEGHPSLVAELRTEFQQTV